MLVRWFGVRGYGEQQEAQKWLTESKILAFLSVRPQTSEELWKNSKIHKNTLVKRLAELVELKLVIKHRYAFAYNERNYGFLFKLNYEPTAKKGRVYYILNLSNVSTKARLLSYFKIENIHENMEDKLIESNLNPLVELTSEKLCSIENDRQELKNCILELLLYFVNIHNRRLEIDFNLVQNRIGFTRKCRYDLDTSRSIISDLSEISESIFDIIIRLMTDPVWIGWPKASFRQRVGDRWTDLWNYVYADLWKILENESRIPLDLKSKVSKSVEISTPLD